MNIFSKKETLTQNMTYMAIMAAINVVFILLSVFVPYLYLLLLFILPLTSTYVILFCKKRYYPIYAITTIGLCFLASFNNIGDTFFYIIPSIIVGFLTGILLEKRINSSWIIIITSLAQFVISLSTLPLIKLITEVDLMESIFTLFGLNSFSYKNYLIGPLIYFTSIAQMTITYLVLKNEIEKIKINFNENFKKLDILFLFIYEILMFASSFIFFFINKELTFLFLLLGLLPSIILIVYEISHFNKIRLIIMGVLILIFPIIFAAFYPMLDAPVNFNLISILFILINIPTFIRIFSKQ